MIVIITFLAVTISTSSGNSSTVQAPVSDKLITHVPYYLWTANTTTVKHIPLKSLSNVSGQSEIISGPNNLCHCHTAKVNQCLHRNGHVVMQNKVH